MNRLRRASSASRLGGSALCLLLVALLPAGAVAKQPLPPGSYALAGGQLRLAADGGELQVIAHTPAAVEVVWIPAGEAPVGSFSIAATPSATLRVSDASEEQLRVETGDLTLVIDRPGPGIRFLRGEQLLSHSHGFFRENVLRGVRFSLADDEQLIGGGQRVLGMDRRGHRLPLYNKPAYGYAEVEGAPVDQMYYGLPAVLSDRGYLLLWDNAARGAMDLGAQDPDILQFHAVAGRMAFLFVAGDDFPDTIAHYTAVTGRQPMPPRWSFGNYASRFGYRSTEQVRDVVRRFREAGIPLETVVLDIYWFGSDIQGHMGNLAWDREHFPEPEALLRFFRDEGLHTLLVTEPYVLTSSRRWTEAVEERVLATAPGGEPKRFDFYFGNTGLVDVFEPAAQQWFWEIYRELIEAGMDGVWGDLGEPEVHPEDTLHRGGSADVLHNAYGHRWAQLVYEGYLRDFPGRRPMILMRSGFAGSQRYGMIPWTGDVLRDWSGLAPQVELSLQMGLLGLAYTHSDLGGFAGGTRFDPELYLRWLQFGVFQPLFRPHAQEHIAPEPVFHGDAVANAARKLIELRYRLMPYLYTLAWENANTGMPLARPLFFLEPDKRELFSDDRAFLWGRDLLVAPVTEAGLETLPVYLPAGVWFDLFTEERYEGGRELSLPVHADQIPVLVRAGAMLPMVPAVQRLRDYSSGELTLHYYGDASVARSTARVYEDDGETRNAYEAGAYELLSFSADRSADGQVNFDLSRSAGDYRGRPEHRRLTLRLHNRPATDTVIRVNDGNALPPCSEAVAIDCFSTEASARQLVVHLRWDGAPQRVSVR
jgi:oligosaccharide 4-alpha-D-glucosyltransferase